MGAPVPTGAPGRTKVSHLSLVFFRSLATDGQVLLSVLALTMDNGRASSHRVPRPHQSLTSWRRLFFDRARYSAIVLPTLTFIDDALPRREEHGNGGNHPSPSFGSWQFCSSLPRTWGRVHAFLDPDFVKVTSVTILSSRETLHVTPRRDRTGLSGFGARGFLGASHPSRAPSEVLAV